MPWSLTYRIERRAWVVPGGCWLWMGGLSSDGYGRTRHAGRSIGAHQLSHLAYKGPVAAGQCVQHTCDNRWCVNPDHLVAGTYTENNLAVWKRGGRVPKLSEEAVCSIRSSTDAQVTLATRYGVHQSTISKVKRGVARVG